MSVLTCSSCDRCGVGSILAPGSARIPEPDPAPGEHRSLKSTAAHVASGRRHTIRATERDAHPAAGSDRTLAAASSAALEARGR